MTREPLTVSGSVDIIGGGHTYKRIIETRRYDELLAEARKYTKPLQGQILVRRPIDPHNEFEAVIIGWDNQRNRIIINNLVNQFDMGINPHG